MVRRGTLEGRRIWIGCEDCEDCEYCEDIGSATRWAGGGWRDMDSRDVLEKETSDGVVRPWSCELRFPRLKSAAKTPMCLPSELRRLAHAPKDPLRELVLPIPETIPVVVVSVVSTA